MITPFGLMDYIRRNAFFGVFFFSFQRVINIIYVYHMVLSERFFWVIFRLGLNYYTDKYGYTRGGRKIPGCLAVSQEPINIFQKILLFFFSVPLLRLYTFAIFVGAFVFCLCTMHEVDLLFRFRFTAEIKAVLVSYLFPASFFSVLEKNKSSLGRDLGCTDDGTTIAT